MSDDNSKLTRRRVLGGLATVGAAGAIGGAGTMAYFSDTEESTGNSVSAGTMDLNINGDDSAVTTLDVADKAPGDSGSESHSISNSGTVDGVVDVLFSSASNNEGDTSDAEGDTSSPGDLGGVLEVDVYLDDDGDTSSTGDQTVAGSGTFDSVFDGSEADANHPLPAGGSSNLVIEWEIPTTAGNDIQGDSVSGDISVELGQVSSQ